MKVPKIQTVCGFGCGSSLMLRMNIEAIAKKAGVAIEAFAEMSELVFPINAMSSLFPKNWQNALKIGQACRLSSSAIS